MGACKGLQILVHAGILPGELLQNKSGEFFCDDVDCRVEDPSFFNGQRLVDNVYSIPIAHGFGRYNIDPETNKQLLANHQIFLRYHGMNPNGSVDRIAGICNKEGTIFGMMPHPERADATTRQLFLEAIENYVKIKRI